MSPGQRDQFTRIDHAAQRLLDEIGVSDLEYYSADHERAVGEALQAWSLLAAVSKSLSHDASPESRMRLVEDIEDDDDLPFIEPAPQVKETAI